VRRFQGLELRCVQWHMDPLAVEEVHSSFFEDAAAFPPGSVEFDCALLMRGIRHEWRAREDLCCPLETVEPVIRPADRRRAARADLARGSPAMTMQTILDRPWPANG